MSASLVRLGNAVDSLIVFIQSLPDDRLTPRPWGPREVLVHLVFWHETHAAILAALLRGEEPKLPNGTFAEINARAVRQNAAEPVGRLIHRLRTAQAELERLVASEGSAFILVRSKEGAKPRTLDDSLLRMEAHVRNHEADLRKQRHDGRS